MLLIPIFEPIFFVPYSILIVASCSLYWFFNNPGIPMLLGEKEMWELFTFGCGLHSQKLLLKK